MVVQHDCQIDLCYGYKRNWAGDRERAMNKKQTYFLAAILLVIWLLFVSVLRGNFPNTSFSVRWFNDDYDRSIYMQRGEWLPDHGIPYVDVLSEYPQIPTYLFGLIYFVTPAINVQLDYYVYSSIFSLLMLVILFFTIRMLYGMLSERKWLAYLMFLPGALNFTYNRFDILPAFLALWSLFFLKRRKFIATGIILGLGTFTKWYPALLLPIFVSYDYAMYKRLNWKMILAFSFTCLIIALPTLLTGGLAAFMSPFIFHANRSLEQVSLPRLLDLFIFNLGTPPNTALLSSAFLVIQFLPAPLSLFMRIDTEEKVLQWMILVIGFFILFSRIFSPQWLLWLMPFLILAVCNWFDIAWIVIYNLAAYFTYPIIFDFFGPDSGFYRIGGGVIVVVLMIILMVAVVRAKVKFSWQLFSLFRKQASQ
jgi:uncharacterized membrane protein